MCIADLLAASSDHGCLRATILGCRHEEFDLVVRVSTAGTLSLDANIQVTVGLAGAALGSCTAGLDSNGQLGFQIQIADSGLHRIQS